MEHLGQLNNEEEGEHFANESIHYSYAISVKKFSASKII